MARRLRERACTFGAILPLLVAVLSAGLVPHLHAVEPGSEQGFSAATHDGVPMARNLEAADCAACRSGQSSRAAIAVAEARALPAPAVSLRLQGWDDSSRLAARLVRAASPPRAPPV